MTGDKRNPNVYRNECTEKTTLDEWGLVRFSRLTIFQWSHEYHCNYEQVHLSKIS